MVGRMKCPRDADGLDSQVAGRDGRRILASAMGEIYRTRAFLAVEVRKMCLPGSFQRPTRREGGEDESAGARPWRCTASGRFAVWPLVRAAHLFG